MVMSLIMLAMYMLAMTQLVILFLLRKMVKIMQ